MRILIAPNAYKGCLSAADAALCIERGLRQASLSGEFIPLPIADGGDGTLTAFLAGGGARRAVTARDPLGRERIAEYALLSDGRTAVVEMARASGYALLADAEREPMRTTSYGTGQLLAAAKRQAAEIILGVGGSATVDGGAGALQALGMIALDAAGREMPRLTGGLLRKVARIDLTNLASDWRDIPLTIASDVQNPVLGEIGAAVVFGPQKGATPAQVRELEAGLGHFFALLKAATGEEVTTRPGSGAAGALAGGLMAVLGGRIEPGCELLLRRIGFAERLKQADLVITGEGYLDEQTLAGKGPLVVTRQAQAAGVPTVALVGGSALIEARARAAGFSRVVEITPKEVAREIALAQAPQFLTAAARKLGAELQRGVTILL